MVAAVTSVTVRARKLEKGLGGRFGVKGFAVSSHQYSFTCLRFKKYILLYVNYTSIEKRN